MAMASMVTMVSMAMVRSTVMVTATVTEKKSNLKAFFISSSLLFQEDTQQFTNGTS